MPYARRWSTGLAAALLALVVVATGNLSGIGISDRALLYDIDALPRLVIALVMTSAAWAFLWLGETGEERPAVRGDVVWGLLGGLAGWAVLSASLSPHRLLAVLGQSERLEGAVTIALYAAVYGLGLQVVRRAHDVRRLLGWFAIACSALAAYGVLQFLGIDPADHTLAALGFSPRRAFATFGNPNFFAALLVIGWPCAVALALDAARPGVRRLWAGAALLMVSALLVTFTRTAWAVAALQALVGAVIWRRAGGRLTGGARYGIAASVLVLSVLAVVSIGSGPETDVFARLREATSNAGSVVERAEVAKVALAAAAERPLTGFGPDAFLPAFRLLRTDAYARTFGPTGTVNNAHSWPLQFLATTGVPGAVLLLAALGVALVRGKGHLSVDQDGPAGRFLLAGLWVACAGYAVVMLATVSVIGASIPFWLLMGAMAAPAARQLAVRPTLTRALFVVGAVTCVACVAGGVLLIRADVRYLASRDAYHAGEYGRAATLAAEASGLNVLSVKYARGEAQALAALAATGDGSGQAAAGRYDEVLRRHPADYATLAWAAALHGSASMASGDVRETQRAVRFASTAARLDRQNAALASIARGDISASAVNAALAVPALP